MTKIRHLSLYSRAINKATRLASDTKSISKFGFFEGLSAAFHAKEEIIALRRADWPNLKKHFLYRFSKNKRYANFFSKVTDFVNIGTEEAKLSSMTDTLNPYTQKLSYSECWSLYEYFRYFGDFRIACHLRKSLLRKSIDKQLASKFIFSLDGINAALELGLIDLVNEILKRKVPSPLISPLLDELTAYVALLSGDKDKAYNIWSKTFDENDHKYLGIIKGRDVALVGPAPVEEYSGNEIDSADCVIRTNYRVGSNVPYEKFGSRTDISYYNQYRINQRWDETCKAFDNLDWIIAKSQKDENKIRKVKEHKNTRSSFLPHTIFFQTSAPMGIIVALGDILRFQPSTLKVFSSTFYFSKQTYSQNYKSTDTSRALASSDLRVHEPFSQFAYAKHLLDRNIISADSATANVLGVGEPEYSTTLQSLYGKFSLVK